MNNIVVLGGAGAMGQVIVRDLAQTSGTEKIIIADFNKENADKLKQKIASGHLETTFADIKDSKALAKLLNGCALVINSTPYYLNVQVMEAALESGCHYIDLGGLFHVTKKQLELDQRFKARNLLAILGMGAAPGMTNVMAAEGASDLDTVEAIDISVGCVDFVTLDHPLSPPYALDTILDEYTKEPIVFENGKFLARPPMSGELSIDFPQPVGKVKAILTLHSEVLTLPDYYGTKGVKQVTFRLGLPPEFHDRLKLLVDIGLAGTEPVVLSDSSSFVPRKALAKLLEKFPAPDQDPNDCEVVRVDVKGKAQGKERLQRLESIIYSNPDWKVSCGALDTGVPPSIVAQMVVNGSIPERGVLAPESCVPRPAFFQELAKRKIVINKTSHELEATRR